MPVKTAGANLDSELARCETSTNRIWADTVCDPTDIRSLVGLNVYGLDWLRGTAGDVRIESEHGGFEIQFPPASPPQVAPKQGFALRRTERFVDAGGVFLGLW